MAKYKKSSRRPAGTWSTRRYFKASRLMDVGRWGVALTIVAILTLVGTGIVTIQFSEGRPTIALKPGWIQEAGNRVRQFSWPASIGGTAPTDSKPMTTGSKPKAIDTSPADVPADEPVRVTVNDPGNNPGNDPGNAPGSVAGADTIKIASFNIQVFGTSKLQKPNAMNVLTHVIREFDVIAIQEVRSVDDNVMPAFVKMVNANGRHYDFVIGPRLGRTTSKEQYAMVFDADRIQVDYANVYQTEDAQDLLHREPMVARFRVRGVPPERAFTFSLVNIHTDPDETGTELDALAETFRSVQHDGSREDDIILLGDLNVDERHLGNLGRIPNITYAISGVTTNTRRNKTYDNIIFDRVATSEYTRRSGVLDLMETFHLTEVQALEVSDHCPVWAEFSVYESGTVPYVTGRPANRTR